MADCTAGLRKHGNLDQAREIAQLQALERTYAEFKEEHDLPQKRFFRDSRGGRRACQDEIGVIANVTRHALEHCDPVGNPVDGPVASGWRQSPTAVSMSAPVDTRIRVLHSTCCCVGPPVHHRRVRSTIAQSDAASRCSHDRPTSRDAAGHQGCSSSHSAFCPRDCSCDLRSPIGLSATAESPTRATTPFANPRGSCGGSPTSPLHQALIERDACCLTSFLMIDRRRPPAPRIATIRGARAPAAPTPKALDPDFRDDESTGRSDDATGARHRPHGSKRRLHRPERRLP